jgi:copper chaperone NosL
VVENHRPEFKVSVMKQQLPRLLMFAAVVCLAGLFVFPMWKITLYAPQYPDGVRLRIHINKLSGDTPGTLQTVNILNHYVGMKRINEDSIPELSYLKYIIAGMIFLGLIMVIVDRKPAFLAWTILMGLLAVAGIYDFYLWEYDYGHTLSPDAPIKIPGTSFQPPLIGSKAILNFVAKSFPDWGGYLAALAIVLAGSAGLIKKSKKHASSRQKSDIRVKHPSDRLQYVA